MCVELDHTSACPPTNSDFKTDDEQISHHISSIRASVCPTVFVHHRLSPTLESNEDPQHIDLTGKLHPLSLHVVHDDDEINSGQRWERSGKLVTSSAG